MRRRATRVVVLVVALLLTVGAAFATGLVIQSEGLRITVLSQVQPFRLPRAFKAGEPLGTLSFTAQGQ